MKILFERTAKALLVGVIATAALMIPHAQQSANAQMQPLPGVPRTLSVSATGHAAAAVDKAAVVFSYTQSSVGSYNEEGEYIEPAAFSSGDVSAYYTTRDCEATEMAA